MRRILFLATAGFATIAWANSALACSCVPTSRDEIIAKAETVFRGTVRAVSTSGNGGSLGATVFVTRRIKGNAPDRVLAITARAAVACGFPMIEGQEYDFAGTVDERGRIRVNSCIMAPLNPLAP